MTKTQGWLILAALFTLCAHTAPASVRMLYFLMAIMAFAASLITSTKEGL